MNSTSSAIGILGEEFPPVFQKSKEILEIILSSELQETLALFRTAIIVLSAIAFVLGIVLLLKSDYMDWLFLNHFRDFSSKKSQIKKKAIRRWEKNKKKFEKAKAENEWKLSLLTGADILGDALKRAGFRGDTLSEKVSQLSAKEVSAVEELKNTIFKCQTIAENPETPFGRDEAEKHIKTLDKAIKDISKL